MSGRHLDLELWEAVSGTASLWQRTRVRRHLAGCADCRRRHAAYERAFLQLLSVTPRAAPPPQIRARVLAAVRPALTGRRVPSMAAALAVLTVALAVLTWVVVAPPGQEVDGGHPALQDGPSLAAIDLWSPEGVPRASGFVVIRHGRETCTLVTEGLPPLAAGQYVISFISAGVTVSESSFTVQSERFNALTLPFMRAGAQTLDVVVRRCPGDGREMQTVLRGRMEML